MNTIFLDFPLPPSVNDYLMPVAGKVKINKYGKPYRAGHLTKTKIHDDFWKECVRWHLSAVPEMARIRAKIMEAKRESEARGELFALRVDMYFVFHVDRLISNRLDSKKLDRDNRIKPATDAISKLLLIDDKYFYAGFSEKVTTENKENECTIIQITQTSPRTLQDVMDQMKKSLAI